MIKDSWGVDGLETKIFVIEMSNEQALGSESVWLNVYICLGDTSQETGFTDIWISADKESSGVRIDGWKTTEMLTNLFKVE